MDGFQSQEVFLAAVALHRSENSLKPCSNVAISIYLQVYDKQVTKMA